jgi:hypothetical protein
MARFRVREEAANWAGEIVDAARQVRHGRLAVLLTWAASSAWSSARLDEAKRHGEEAISLASNADFDPFVWAFADLAMVASYEGDVDRAITFARAGADHAADRHDRFCLAMLSYFLAIGGRGDEAMQIADTTLSKVEATGVPASIGIAHWAKGKAFATTDTAVALAAYQRGVAVSRQSGNRFWEIMIILEIAALQARSGKPISALHSFGEMLDLWRRSSDMMFASHGLGSLIVLFDRLGHAAAAATLNGMLTRTFESNPFVPDLAGAVAHVRGVLGDAEFDRATQYGAAMALHDAHDYAVDQVGQALVALGVGDA